MVSPGARITLTAADEAKLAKWLDGELNEGMDAHEQLEDQLDLWQRAYLGEPVAGRKTFPWDGACNIVIPMIGITVDSIVARLVNTIFSVDPFWSARAMIKELEPNAKPVQDFLEWSRKREFNIYKTVKPWAIEVIKFGWGYIKVPWEVYTTRSFKVGPRGKAIPVDRVTRRANPQHVLLMDIVCQAGVEDELQQSEWMAHRIRLTDGQLKWRAHDGMYDKAAVDKVIDAKEDMSATQERLSSQPEYTAKEKLNTIYEVWANYPIAKDGLPVAIVVTYHRPTRTILRAMYNPHITGIRPFVKGKFIEWEGRRRGFGIARHLAQLQEEITTLHRQQVDNATLANTRFFVGRRGVIKNGTRIWPGRLITVPDPDRDFKPMQMGEVYPSMRALEVSALSYAERRSGVSDYQLGRESSVLGNRATATGTLALIQEGNRRFDLNVRDMRDALGQVGQLVLLLNAQYRPKGVEYFVEGQDGHFVREILDLPEDFIVDGMGVELTASTATINKEVEKQGLIVLMQLTTQYYDRLMQGAMLASNPQAPPEMKQLAIDIANAQRALMERIVQQFDVKSIDTLLPALEGAVNLGIGQESLGVPAIGASQNGQLGSLLELPAGAATGPAGAIAGSPELGGAP